MEKPEPGLWQLLCYQGLDENEGNMLITPLLESTLPEDSFPSSPESCFLLLQVSSLPSEHYRWEELGSFRMSSNVCVCCCSSLVPRLQIWAACWCFQVWPILELHVHGSITSAQWKHPLISLAMFLLLFLLFIFLSLALLKHKHHEAREAHSQGLRLWLSTPCCQLPCSPRHSSRGALGSSGCLGMC